MGVKKGGANVQIPLFQREQICKIMDVVANLSAHTTVKPTVEILFGGSATVPCQKLSPFGAVFLINGARRYHCTVPDSYRSYQAAQATQKDGSLIQHHTRRDISYQRRGCLVLIWCIIEMDV